MHIHDVNVLADPNRRIPAAPEPEKADGTSDGAAEVLEHTPESQSLLDLALSAAKQIVDWWEGWWPRVHSMLTFAALGGGSAEMHVSIDLLFEFRIENLYFETPVDNQMTAMQKEDWNNETACAVEIEEGPLTDFFRLVTAFVLGSLAVISTAFLVPLPPPIAAVMVCLTLAEWLVWIASMTIAVYLGLITCEFYVGIMWLWLAGVVGSAVTAVGFIELMAFLIWAADILSWGWLKIRVKWTVFAIGFQFTLAAVSLFIFAHLMELSLQNYMEAL